MSNSSLNYKVQRTSSELGQSSILSEIVQQSHLASKKPPLAHHAQSQPPSIQLQKTASNFKPSTSIQPHNSPQQHQFLQMYDQNIQLKKNRQQLERKNEALQLKIDQLKVMMQKDRQPITTDKDILEVVKLKKQNRDLNRTLSLMRSNKGHSAVKSKAHEAINDHQRQKLDDLLKIIDIGKKTQRQLEQQLKMLQRQNQMLKQDSMNKSVIKNKEIMRYEHELKKQQQAQEKLYDKQRELEHSQQKVAFLEAEIGRLQATLSTKNLAEQQIFDLRLENRKLQESLRKLSQAPLFRNPTERVEDGNKTIMLQQKCKMLEERAQKDREKAIQLQTSLKLLEGKMVDVTFECQQLEKDNRILKEKVRENPISQLIGQDEETLFKVVGFLKANEHKQSVIQSLTEKLDSRSRSSLYNQGNLQQKVQTLISEKEFLAVELNKATSALKALKETAEQREKIFQIEERNKQRQIEQKDKKIRDLEVVTGQKGKADAVSGGVRYEDSVSVFSTDETTIQKGNNYFDLYLGNIVLVESMVRMEANIADIKKLVTFLTVDFYNHQTENSKLGSGSTYNVNSQFSFRITQDNFFMGFLEKGTLTVDIWCSEGTKALSLGTCKIGLKPLIMRSRPNVAPVINSSCPIYLNNKAMGTLNYVMRMRLPFFDQVKEYKKLAIDPSAPSLIETRKMVISISQARGLRPNCNAFVYYSLLQTDYYTNTSGGSNPSWDHWNIIQVPYHQDFKNFLQNGSMEFTLLDDNAPLNEQQTDLIGTAKLNLGLLLEDKQAGGVLPIKSNSGVIELTVKVFWYDKNSAMMMKKKDTEKQEDARAELLQKILQYFTRSKLSAEEAFRKFDNNRTGVVSRNEFEAGLVNMGIRAPKNEIDRFFDNIDQPVNQNNFNKRFFPQQLAPKKRESQVKQDKPIIQSFKEVNEIISKNTVDLKRMTMKEFLRGKQGQLLSVALDMDANNDGTITKAELQKYLSKHGIEAEVQEDKVNIMDFLKRYSSTEVAQPPIHRTDSVIESVKTGNSRLTQRKLSKR